MYFFSLVMVFVPMNFFMTKFLTRHYVIQDEQSRGNVRKLDDNSSRTLVLFIVNMGDNTYPIVLSFCLSRLLSCPI